jgi:hypothetical protein
MVHATAEARRWLDPSFLSAIGFAAFVDLAHATRRLPAPGGDPFLVDAGLGLRIRFPGRDGLLRIDYGRGLLDRADALSAAWQF